jgi:3-hydroxyisobutyrate dehydrogenase-like beta-hydroxyacid dehydrogenase
MQEHPLTVCGFLGFGEVASRFAQRLRERGARVLAYDVLLDRPGGRDVLVSRAIGPAPDFPALPELTARADIVLSTVTTDVALSAAKTCVPLLRAGQVYVDLNATSPSVKREAASVIEPSGADFVEGAILSAIGVAGADAKVLLCGARASELAAVLSQLGLNAHAYGIEIGKASSFKMLRSVFSKGIEALLIECLLAGRRAGIEQALWEEIVATMDAASFDDVGGNWVRTHATAHARRSHEMRQVADVLRELRVDAPMTAATLALFERSTRIALKDAFPAPPASAAEVIAALDARIDRLMKHTQGQ